MITRNDMLILLAAILLLPCYGLSQVSISGWECATRTWDVFTLDEKNDSTWIVDLEKTETLKLLSRRRTEPNEFLIHEPFFAPIKKLRVRLNSSYISEVHISYGRQPEQDVLLSENSMYTVNFPKALTAGDSISCSYRQRFSDIGFLPIPLIPNADSLRGYTATFNHPDDVTVDFEMYFPRDSIPFTIDRSSTDETILSFGNVNYVAPLKLLPTGGYHAAILVWLRRGEKVVNPVLPADFAAWYYKKTTPYPTLDSADVRKLEERISRYNDARGNLRAAHEYVRNSIRYVADARGLNSFIPHSPSLTLSTQFGDCKDKVSLVSAIARARGVATIPALVPSPGSPRFTGVHVTMFNHVINAFGQGTDVRFSDPTARYCEFGNLPESDLEKPVFLLDPGGARYMITPIPQRLPSLEIDVVAHLDSLRNCRAVLVLRNNLLMDALYARHEFTEEKYNQALQRVISNYLYQMRLDSCTTLAEEEGSLTLSGTLDLSAFVLRSRDKYYVPRAPFAQFDNDVLEREQDPYQIVFSSTINLLLRIRTDAPASMITPEHVWIQQGALSFTANADTAGGTVQFDYSYSRNTTVIVPAMKQDFIVAYKQYLQNKRNVFALIRR
jgi:hypothetical protein